MIDFARSYVNAIAWPDPTVFVVTAGFGVAVVAFEYNVASVVAVPVVYLSAVPWNWIVWLTIPAPGPEALTSRYASLSVDAASVSPSRLASCLSGRIAIRLPPPFTLVVNIDTWAAVNDVWPRIATSYDASVVAVTFETSTVRNSLTPSLRRISA